MIRSIMMAALILALCSPVLADYKETQKLDLPADDITKLNIDCGAGFLEVEGIEGATEIRVKAEIVIEDVSAGKAKKIIENEMILRLEKHGRSAELESGFEQSKSLFGNLFSHGSRMINLTVEVPKIIQLNIDDGSGSISVRNIAGDISVDDGSGELEIVDVEGDIEVDDGSGEILITGVTGNVEISDGSGEIDIREIDGDVVVRDGSGDILINGVTKDVEIADDGSGKCRIRNVDGRVYEP